MSVDAAARTAVACPAWCVAADEPDHHSAFDDGYWHVHHRGAELVVPVGEGLPDGLAESVVVWVDEYRSSDATESYGPHVTATTRSARGDDDQFVLVPDQAVRLAAVLLQQASSAVAAADASTAVTR